MQSLYTASFGYWSDSLRTWVDTFERIPVPAKRYIFARLDGIQTCVDLHQHIAVPKTPSKRQRSPEQYRTVTPASVQAQLPLPTPSPSPTKRRRIVHDDSGPSYPPPSSSPSSVHDLTVETTPQVASNRMSQADFDAYLDAYRPQSPSPAYTPLQTGQEHENERRIPAVRPTNFSSIDAIRDWLQTAPRSKRATFPFLYTSDNCLLYGAMATLSNAAPLNSDPAKASHILGRTVKQQTLSENKKIWLNLSPTIKKHALQVGPAAGLWTDHRAART